MWKICAVTAARSEYGLLRWLLQDIKADPDLELQLVVTGSHLAAAFGNTVAEIEEHGFKIDARIDMGLDDTSKFGLAKSLGRCATLFAETLHQLKPDLLLVLGDRYELLPICSAALLLDIPIAHISGGDVTEGAIDDQVRHAVTKMAALHLVSSQEAARRVRQMGEEDWRVCLAGGPGMDNLRRLPLLGRKALALDLGLDPAKDWALMTWHPETKISLETNLQAVEHIVQALADQPGLQTIATYANADHGGSEINQYLEQAARERPGHLVVCPSLGQLRYVNMLREAKFMIGNSSSAIFETPALRLPAINIGNRQKGRFLTPNIIACGAESSEITAAIAHLNSPAFKAANQNFDSPYGNGFFAEKALSALKEGLAKGRETLLLKKFVDLPGA